MRLRLRSRDSHEERSRWMGSAAGKGRAINFPKPKVYEFHKFSSGKGCINLRRGWESLLKML
ncbi:hypothetical protein E2C01_031273 [Portunus trituberculatus]|uniref:Uncharacterized protein n=1 Tax=Portunus trituberculatus TaxID=210409 RepID=A0A5B7ET08_PORTR|nr:hypothetical protein [Portunus trituberculatus]